MTGAPVLAFGGALSGRSPMMRRLADEGVGGGEGLDLSFAPDIVLHDGQVIEGDGWHLTVLHTPGHSGGHVSLLWDDQIFCGDVVMGWSSTIISPPDGDLADYLRSLDRLAHHRPRRLLPSHGEAITDPQARLSDLAAHRRQRSAQILTALRDGPADAASLAARIYEVAPALMPAAARNVLAHLLALADLGAVVPLDVLGAKTRFMSL
jgi:glyoxylase-like metal-dependent hydrolase (beta-lactamase superfamily II)